MIYDIVSEVPPHLVLKQSPFLSSLLPVPGWGLLDIWVVTESDAPFLYPLPPHVMS